MPEHDWWEAWAGVAVVDALAAAAGLAVVDGAFAAGFSSPCCMATAATSRPATPTTMAPAIAKPRLRPLAVPLPAAAAGFAMFQHDRDVWAEIPGPSGSSELADEERHDVARRRRR